MRKHDCFYDEARVLLGLWPLDTEFREDISSFFLQYKHLR
jgi:hypothetical protein